MSRARTRALLAGGFCLACAAFAAAQASVLAQVQPGLWEISGAPGAHIPVRECVGDIAALARFEHRSSNCTSRVLKDSGNSTEIEYSCPGAGFGHTQIDVLTPRALRISTQGISGGLPFNYVLQARRVEDCAKNVAATRH